MERHLDFFSFSALDGAIRLPLTTMIVSLRNDTSTIDPHNQIRALFLLCSQYGALEVPIVNVCLTTYAHCVRILIFHDRHDVIRRS